MEVREGDRFKHTAWIITSGGIVAVGSNEPSYIIFGGKRLAGATHAEENALKRFLHSKNHDKHKIRRCNYSLLVIRYNYDGELRSSKPCVMCLKKIKEAGIKKVYYSTDEGDIVCERSCTMETDHLSVLYQSILSGNYNE